MAKQERMSEVVVLYCDSCGDRHMKAELRHVPAPSLLEKAFGFLGKIRCPATGAMQSVYGKYDQAAIARLL